MIGSPAKPSDRFLVILLNSLASLITNPKITLRSGISGDTALDELFSGDSNSVMTLLRMAGVGRETAAGLLAGIGDLLGIADPGQAIARFDSMSDADVADALSWLTADPAYKQAAAVLGTNDGQRTL